MAYDNHTDKTTYIKKTGSEIITGGSDGAYTVDVSTLLDSTKELSATLADQDELIVVRKFDASTISDSDYTHSSSPITADEAWSAWTLPNSSDSGSTMYSISEGVITFSTTATDYTWTTAMSGRTADISLPVIASGDTIYVMRKTYNLSKFVQWTTGSKITAANLNQATEQLLFISQELMQMVQNLHNFNPAVGQPNGICPLNASGEIASDYLGATASVGDGLTGNGSGSSPIAIDISGDSLAFSSGNIFVDVVTNTTTSSTTKALSASAGKALQDSINTLGTGVAYKGAGNMVDDATFYNSIYGSASKVTGDTVVNTKAGSNSADSSWGSLGTITQYDTIRWSGSAWQIVDTNSYIKTDGSTALHADQAATTQANTDSSTKLATTAWVRTHTGASSDNLTFDKIPDVYVNDSTPAANDMVYYDGDSWEPIALENTFGAGEKVITTGSSLAALSDVGAAASGSGDNGKALIWDGDSWEPTALSSQSPTVVVCGGTGDGSANESSNVNTAFNDSNLGHTGSPGASTLRVLEMRGRRHRCGSGTAVTAIEVPWKQEITIQNGHLEFDLGDTASATMITSATSSRTTLATTAAHARIPGRHVLEVASVSGYAVGDRVVLAAGNTDSATTALNYVGGTRFHGSQILEIVDINSTYDVLTFSEPIVISVDTSSTLTRYGGGTNGVNQRKDILLENMKFSDKLSQKIELQDNPITKASSTTGTLAFPASHGMAISGKFSLRDVHTNGAIGINNYSGSLNQLQTITGVSTNTITFTLGNSSQWGATGGTMGGTTSTLFISHQSGISLEDTHDLVLRNCVFDGFNEYGLQLLRCSNVLIENCTFKNCHAITDSLTTTEGAIVIDACDNVTIKNCKFENCSQAIKIKSSSNLLSNKDITVTDCSISAYSAGIYLYDTVVIGGFTVTNNKIYSTPYHQSIITFRRDKGSTSSSASNMEAKAIGAAGDGVIWHKCDISNNDMLDCIAVGDMTSSTYSATGYYGNPSGFTVTSDYNVDHQRNQIPAWHTAIDLRVGQRSNDYPFLCGKFKINDNHMKSQRYGLYVTVHANADDSTDRVNHVIDICRNNIESHWGMIVRSQDATSKLFNNQVLYGSKCDENNIHVINIFEKFMEHDTDDTWINQPRGIDYDVTEDNTSAYGIWFADCSWSKNIIRMTSATNYTHATRYGLILGRRTPVYHSYNRISLNNIRGFSCGIKTYNIKGDSTKAGWQYSQMHDNSLWFCEFCVPDWKWHLEDTTSDQNIMSANFHDGVGYTS